MADHIFKQEPTCKIRTGEKIDGKVYIPLEKFLVEVKPIVHAKWIRGIEDEPDSDHYCSNCMGETSAIRAGVYEFCPFCGADMDLER